MTFIHSVTTVSETLVSELTKELRHRAPPIQWNLNSQINESVFLPMTL